MCWVLNIDTGVSGSAIKTIDYHQSEVRGRTGVWLNVLVNGVGLSEKPNIYSLFPSAGVFTMNELLK